MRSEEEQTWPTVDRRQTPFPPSDCAEVYRQLIAEVEQIKATVTHLERCIASLKTAFVINDLGKPDFDGHRKSHHDMITAAKTMDAYKEEGMISIIKWVAGAVLAALLLGLGEWVKGVAK